VIKDKSFNKKIEEAVKEASEMIKYGNETLEKAKENILRAR